jgi:transcriptional regulator with GAF, ATPase, and Fis domain
MSRIFEQAPSLQLLGNSPATRALRGEIELAANSEAKVLITGETGVGKEVVARLIHERSARRAAAMATVNCAGVPDSLIESELFGHVRGSFTDAYRDKAGIFESTANGTVFLDEVGEMSLRMQAVLLRFLESGEIQRVGSDRAHTRVNVRIVAATNRDLPTEIAGGGFRRDLYYRLNVLHIHVTPLRERRDDIQPLLDFYLERHCRSCRLSSRALDLLVAYRWPGNVRQLKNVVERLALKGEGMTFEPDHLPRDLWDASDSASSSSPRVDSRVLDTQAIETQLLSRMSEAGESFWSVVYAPFMERDLCRAQLKAVVARGLERTAGNYRLVVELFNMPPTDYKRFLNVLRNHDCHFPPRSFRCLPVGRTTAGRELTQSVGAG